MDLLYGKSYYSHVVEYCYFSEPKITININGSILQVSDEKPYWLELDGLNILTQPLLSSSVSKLTLPDSTLIHEKDYLFSDLAEIDVVVLSNVYSTYSIDSNPNVLRELKLRHSPTFIVPLGWKSSMESYGIDEVQELDWWEDYYIDKNVSITYAPALHY